MSTHFSQIVPFTRKNAPESGKEIEVIHEDKVKRAKVHRYEIDEENVTIFVKDPKTGKEIPVGHMLYIEISPESGESSGTDEDSEEEDDDKKKGDEKKLDKLLVDFGNLELDGKRSKGGKTRKSKQPPIIKQDVEKFERGKLHSGSKHGPLVKSLKQALAIGYSASRK